MCNAITRSRLRMTSSYKSYPNPTRNLLLVLPEPEIEATSKEWKLHILSKKIWKRPVSLMLHLFVKIAPTGAQFTVKAAIPIVKMSCDSWFTSWEER